MAEKVYISTLNTIFGYHCMSDKKQNIKLSAAIPIIALLISCSPKAQPTPTPDMGRFPGCTHGNVNEPIDPVN
jgi:hypothetical protein